MSVPASKLGVLGIRRDSRLYIVGVKEISRRPSSLCLEDSQHWIVVRYSNLFAPIDPRLCLPTFYLGCVWEHCGWSCESRRARVQHDMIFRKADASTKSQHAGREHNISLSASLHIWHADSVQRPSIRFGILKAMAKWKRKARVHAIVFYPS